ncbi:MAG: response regulator transcription factor [Steroidobacteraceae bacterium]
MTDNPPAGRRALIVDDHPIITDALSTALVVMRVFDGVDKENSLAAALPRLKGVRPYDLILLDLHLGDTHGLEAMQQVREHCPEMPVVIFSGDESSATVAEAFEHGVQGFISKNSPMSVVINAIRVVLAGGIYIPPQAVRMLGFEPQPAGGGQPVAVRGRVPDLSPRQREVLMYVLQGLTNKHIGQRLDMAAGTVKAHLAMVYRMFEVSSRAQLILRAREMGLL